MKIPLGDFFELPFMFPESMSSDRAFNCSTLPPGVLFKITFHSQYHATQKLVPFPCLCIQRKVLKGKVTEDSYQRHPVISCPD